MRSHGRDPRPVPEPPTTSVRTTFGETVATIRKERGLTREQVAWAAGLHATAISRIEQASREPKLETIVKLAHGLGVPIADLFRELPQP
jgi:transcriptional regulator with XRE-family HTH domain